MQNAILSAFLGGITCATIGVFVVLMHMPFIGVCMSHAAFAGALLGLWLGFNPLLGALVFCLGSAAVIGPLADRGELSPETSLGVIFSLMLGLAFLFMGLMPGTKSSALELLWGSILTNTRSDIILLAVVTIVVVGLVFLFYKEIPLSREGEGDQPEAGGEGDAGIGGVCARRPIFQGYGRCTISDASREGTGTPR